MEPDADSSGETQRKEAYANLLETLEMALEVVDSSLEYVAGQDGELYYVRQGGDPETIDAEQLEQLLESETIYGVDLKEMYEFEEVIDGAGTF